MNQLVSTKSKVEIFVGEVLPPDRLDNIIASLPEHVKPERFKRNLIIAITHHPKLLECDPIAVFNEVSKAAALGLYLDPQLGEAYLITGWDSRNNRLAPQLRTGYRGLIKLARQSGQIVNVYAHDVCQNDFLDMALGLERRLEHKPDYRKDRGEVELYYAVVEFADGTKDFEPMSVKDIHRIRDRSDGWKAFIAKKIKSTPWASDEVQMSKKTVLRRLLNRVPQSPELADAFRIDDADYIDHVDSPPPSRSTLADRFSATKALPAAEGFSIEHVVRETGEIIDAPPLQPADDVSEKHTQISDTPVSDSEDTTPSKDQEAAASPNDAAETGVTESSTPQAPVSKELLDTYYKAMKRANKKESVQGYVIQFWKANPGIREHLSENDLKKFATLKGLRIAAIEGTMKSEDADSKAKEVFG